jgi:hypothetical protein
MDQVNPCEQLSKSLKQIRGLQFLRIRGWRVSGSVVPLLVPPLVSHHQSLRHLDIGIEQESADQDSGRFGSPGLRLLTNLTFLHLPTQRYISSGTAISQLLAFEVTASLPKLSCLEGLDLSESGLGCCPHVLGVLSLLHSLTFLKLHRTSVNEETFSVLASSLRSLQTLRKLNMWDYMSRRANCFAQFTSALCMLSRLQSVTVIAAPQFKHGKARALVNALENLPMLTMLDLGNSVTRKEYQDFWSSDFQGRSWLRMKEWNH